MNVNSGKSEWDKISFSNGTYTSIATRNTRGEIEVKIEEKEDGSSGAVFAVFILFGLISLLKTLVFMPLIKSGKIDTFWYLTPAIIYATLALIGIVVLRLTEGKEFLKNHGAEHMVFAAYKSLRKVPSVDEACCFSRISKVCGVTIYSAFITAQLIGYIVFTQTGYAIWEILLVLVPLLFSGVFPFNFLGKLAQFFTTAEPDEENLELAIAAMKGLEVDRVEHLVREFFSESKSSDGAIVYHKMSNRRNIGGVVYKKDVFWTLK